MPDGYKSFNDKGYAGYEGYVKEGYEFEALAEYLERIDRYIAPTIEAHYKEYTKPTDRMVTVVDAPVADTTRKMLLKNDDFLRAFNLLKFIKYLFKPSRGRRGFDAALTLLRGGVLVPEPLAYVERRRFGFFVRGFFFMEYIDGFKSMRDYFADGGGASGILNEAGAVMGRLHAIDCSHGDMKATNFLVKEDEDGRKIYLIDTEDVRSHAKLDKRHRLSDMRRFLKSLDGVTNEDAEGFLIGYADGFGGASDITKTELLG